jgi:hypothetical protein
MSHPWLGGVEQVDIYIVMLPNAAFPAHFDEDPDPTVLPLDVIIKMQKARLNL